MKENGQNRLVAKKNKRSKRIQQAMEMDKIGALATLSDLILGAVAVYFFTKRFVPNFVIPVWFGWLVWMLIDKIMYLIFKYFPSTKVNSFIKEENSRTYLIDEGIFLIVLILVFVA